MNVEIDVVSLSVTFLWIIFAWLDPSQHLNIFTNNSLNSGLIGVGKNRQPMPYHPTITCQCQAVHLFDSLTKNLNSVGLVVLITLVSLVCD